MNIIVFESILEGTPPNARYWAFDTDAETNSKTDLIAFGTSEDEAHEAFIEVLPASNITSLASVSEDLFFALDQLVEALKSDHGAREGFSKELLTAESTMRSAMPVLGGQHV